MFLEKPGEMCQLPVKKVHVVPWLYIDSEIRDHSGYGLSQWDDVTLQRRLSMADPSEWSLRNTTSQSGPKSEVVCLKG